jgi:hypothetical protein
LKSSKGLFWPFFANLFNEMERGGSYTYITKILLVKLLTPKKYFEKQSAWKLAYLYVIYYEVSSLNVSGLRYWRSRICFWTHLVPYRMCGSFRIELTGRTSDAHYGNLWSILFTIWITGSLQI